MEGWVGAVQSGEAVTQTRQLAPAKVIIAPGSTLVLEDAVQMEQRYRGRMRKDLDDLARGGQRTHVGIVGKAKDCQLPSYGLASQAAVAAQVPPVGRVGSGVETTKDGRHFTVAQASSSLIGDGQRCIDGDEARGTRRERSSDEFQRLLVGAQRARGAQQMAVL